MVANDDSTNESDPGGRRSRGVLRKKCHTVPRPEQGDGRRIQLSLPQQEQNHGLGASTRAFTLFHALRADLGRLIDTFRPPLRSSSNPSWEFGARSDHEAGRDSHAANPVESLSCCMTLRKSAIWFQLGMVRPCRAPCSMAFSRSPGPSSAGGAIVAASSQSLTTAAGDGY